MTLAACWMRVVSARASSGSETPMKKVGHSRLKNNIAAACLDAERHVPQPLVEHVVIQICTEEAEHRDGELGDGEAGEVGPRRQAIGGVGAGEVSTAEAGHERGDDDGGGVDVGAGKDDEQPLPDDLIDERSEA